MGRKGKRRRRPSGTSPVAGGGDLAPADEETLPAEDETRESMPDDRDVDAPTPAPVGAERPRGLFGRGLGPESPYPPLGVSLARGIRPVGASPLILGLAFLYLLATWAYYAAVGAEPPSGLMSILTALPPVPSLFDSYVLLQQSQGAVVSLGLVLGVTLLRAVVLAALVPMVVQAVRGQPVRLANAAAGFLRRLVSLLGILTAEVGLALLVFTLVAGFLGTQLALFIVWLVGLQFLAMAPIVVSTEGGAAADGLRRSMRAARLPGMRHLVLVLSYFFFLQITTASPGGALFEATPSILTWAFSLFASFLHVGVLGTLAYRWLAVRELVPSGPARREDREKPRARR